MIEFLGVAFALLAALTWSSRDVILKKGFVTFNPLLGVFAQLLTLLPVVFVYGLARGEWSHIPNIDMRGVSFMAIGGLLQAVIGTSLYFSSMKLIGASRAGTLLPAQTLFAVALAVILIHEEWSVGLLAGAALVILGAYMISLSMKQRQEDVDRKIKLKGMILAVAAAFIWAVGPLFFRLGLISIGSSAWGTMIMGVAALIFGTAIFSRLGVLKELKRLSRKELRLLSAAATLDSIGVVGLLGGLSVSPVVHVIPIISGRPFIIVVLSYLFIRQLERVNWKVLAGMLLVISGVYSVIFM